MSHSTLAGLAAIGLWASLASLTTLTRGIPPFQLLAMSLSIGATLGFIVSLMRGRIHAIQIDFYPFLIGIYGIFGYHALYFSALKLAPPAEANLINYLWPALIVIIYSIITFKKIDIYLIFATILGLASTIILIPISENDRMNGESLYLIGYILAFLAAVNWATYSVALRFFSQIKSDSLSLAIAASAVLGLACHLLFESWEPPTWPTGWLAIIFLGLGPVGAAFFLWDMGMKRGNVALLGILSYATPVCSTLALAAIGATEIDAQILAACILIVSAALLATWKQPT